MQAKVLTYLAITCIAKVKRKGAILCSQLKIKVG